ncbi:MAG: molecular chaperone HtpG [Gammaproteobacteria bacterium]|nr:molecular chaperone HtpG [Gammaproteobacteria bacterium]
MTTETHGFQTEAKKLLHLMINSLYSNREVFLRELISNASDAIDKLRFESLNDSALLDGETDFKISIDFDNDAKTLTVTDNGIGMNRDEVIQNLGTIAKSGTEEFFEQLSGDQKKDASLIGQFGVGFYSSFMVADEVVVLTRKAGTAEGTRWVSSGEDEYSVADVETERGTRVTLKLKQDAHEFCERSSLESVVRKYSDHIAVPVDMPKADSEEKEEGRETVNSAKAMWTRSRSEIKDEEYKEFYKYISHDWEDPVAWSHNRVEGRLDYTSLLYVPKRAPFDLFNPDSPRGLKLYVQRVFIMDEADTFLPLYLRWVKGIVDSSDLPLNVSREMLQDSDAVKTIRSALERRVLDRLEKLAADDSEDYDNFWDEFGAVLKEGTVFDNPNRDIVLKLLRFTTTQDEPDPETGKAHQRTSLKQYVERAPSDQGQIYYVVGDNERAARNSPHLEVFLGQGIEVLIFGDPIDAWMMSNLTEFDGKKFQDITRSDLDLPETSEVEKDEEIEESKGDEPLLKRIKDALEDQVESVSKSKRLVDSPACLVLAEHDMGLHMRRIMASAGRSIPPSKPQLEVNLDHTLVKHMSDEQDEARFKDLAHLLYEQAAFADGSYPIDASAHVKRVNRLLSELLA